MRSIIIPFHALDGGELQLDCHAQLFPLVQSVGADGAEIRKERLKEKDFPLNASKTDVYSAPMELFAEDGSLNPEMFPLAKEFGRSGAGALKVALGYFIPHVFEIVRLKEWLTHVPSTAKLLVENDQTLHGGKIAHLKAFFESVFPYDMPVGMTFDAGNWVFTGEDVHEAVKKLGRYVAYVHLKEVETEGGHIITKAPSMDSKSVCSMILRALPKNCPVGLEFPMQTKEDVQAYVRHFKRSEEDE